MAPSKVAAFVKHAHAKEELARKRMNALKRALRAASPAPEQGEVTRAGTAADGGVVPAPVSTADGGAREAASVRQSPLCLCETESLAPRPCETESLAPRFCVSKVVILSSKGGGVREARPCEGGVGQEAHECSEASHQKTRTLRQGQNC